MFKYFPTGSYMSVTADQLVVGGLWCSDLTCDESVGIDCMYSVFYSQHTGFNYAFSLTLPTLYFLVFKQCESKFETNLFFVNLILW